MFAPKAGIGTFRSREYGLAIGDSSA